MYKIKTVMLSLVLMLPLALSAPIAQADGISSLKNFYAKTNAMRANFYQIVTDRQGQKIQEVYGEMQLKRPNMFRWDYNKPFEQQIISDGKQVWLYDTELAQVTVRALSKALGSSPAALLAGGESLDKNFKLVNLPAKDNLEWVSANPNDTDSGFE
jgi:outer membrane lipoprotein carrier protein